VIEALTSLVGGTITGTVIVNDQILCGGAD
jgi:hypothetical protein